MPVVELVMCPSCGHPQEASERCVACGAALPAPVRTAEARNEPVRRNLAEGATTVELAGRTVTLAHDRLTLSSGEGEAQVFPLAEVRVVQLSSRRLLEAIPAAFVFLLVAALAHNPFLRMLFAALALLFALSVFTHRSYRLRVARKSAAGGKPYAAVWTVARAGGADARRIDAAFERLREGLTLAGVELVR